MDDPRLQEFRRKLERMRDELRAEGDVSLDHVRADAFDGIDDDEQPLTQMNQSIASGRNAARMQQLRAVERAITRIVEAPDMFGLCGDCEENLPLRRLELVPWAELCIACQDKRDRDRPRGRRHPTDYR